MNNWFRRISLGITCCLVTALSGCTQPAAFRREALPASKEAAHGQLSHEEQISTKCPPFDKRQAVAYLVTLSTSTPQDRIAMTTGGARALFAQEQKEITAHWPGAAFNGWRQEIWGHMDLERRSDGTVLITLRHGTDRTQRETLFEFVCSDGWKLSRMGTKSEWFAANPSALPGQDGDLTEALAFALVKDVLDHYGTPRMRVSATGQELERGRRLAVAQSGTPDTVAGLQRTVESYLVLKKETPERVIGEWVDSEGLPSGDHVLFFREWGLWKLADHTEGGQPVPLLTPGPLSGRPLEDSLLGWRLGVEHDQHIHIDDLDPGVDEGPPDLLVQRRHSIYLSPHGLVAIDTKTGETPRGLNIGDPKAAAYTLYGPPNGVDGDWLIYTDGTRRLRIRTDPSNQAVAQVILEVVR